ncbi:MAG TPA: hypothetical protein VHS58_20530 [Acetobacteraceae bacterium]|jgi:tetratricopeptide (TPR) repeat protein|nr:hypothetical protein [Acetobacteraceae bacterium]
MRSLILAALICAAVPALADSRADMRKAEVDLLLKSLATAPDEETAAGLETRIKEMWLQAGSPAATLLMSRGMRDLQNQAADEAEQDFNAVLTLQPDLTEAYERRAVARFAAGDYKGALTDLEVTLQREPRHFAALQTLSRIAEARGDNKGALLAWKKAMELDPKTPGGGKRLQELTRKVEGQAI